MVRFSRRLSICAALVFVAMCAGSVRADMIDNPEYQGLAKFKKDTSVKYTTETDAMGNKTAMEMTKTLTDISPEKATVETKMSMNMNGNKMDLPAQKRDIPAKIEKPAATPSADAPKPETGTEDIKVGDKTYACKWTKVSSEKDGLKSTAKTWTCDDVPGGLVKMESESTGTMASSTKMMLVAVDAK